MQRVEVVCTVIDRTVTQHRSWYYVEAQSMNAVEMRLPDVPWITFLDTDDDRTHELDSTLKGALIDNGLPVQWPP